MKLHRLLSATAIAMSVSLAAGTGIAHAQHPGGHTTPASEVTSPAQVGHPFSEVAEQRGFREWARGVEGAGLQNRLAQGEFTAFVADDAAYGQVPATQRQAWQTDPAAHRAALGHTLVEGRMTMNDLRQRQYVTTIDGQRIPVRVEGDRVWLGDAQIREGDIRAGTTGLIHQMDRVTWPQQQPAAGQQQPGQQQPAAGQQQMQPGQQQMQPRQPQVRERVRKGGYDGGLRGTGVRDRDNGRDNNNNDG